MAYKIVLDAGHGGEDPGAVYKDRKEKDDNLKLTLAVGKILEENGVDVVYTRTTDIYQSPFEKAKAANEAGADFFISFHRTEYPGSIGRTGVSGTGRKRTSGAGSAPAHKNAGTFGRDRIYKLGKG